MLNSVRKFIETHIDLIDDENWDTLLDIITNEHNPLNDIQFNELTTILGEADIEIPKHLIEDKFIELLKWYLEVYRTDEESLPICIFIRKYYDCRMGLSELECAELIEANLKSINPKMRLLDQFGSGNLTQFLLIFEED